MKKCILILPYFGKFKNYFPLFLKSCASNPNYDWMLITDNLENYAYPDNFKIVKMSFEEFQRRVASKFDFQINLTAPYKLCDFKPAYGYILEEDIQDYEYWGHCDCDLLFGNLEKILSPLLEQGYQKIFASGHLTLYKNTYENNRRFMHELNGKTLYKEVFSVREIQTFDEDLYKENVHAIFLSEEVQVYSEDLCANPNVFKSQFSLMKYNPKTRCFEEKKEERGAFFWSDGNVFEIRMQAGKLERKEYLYMHLQMRNMKIHRTCNNAQHIQILPNVFKRVKQLPNSLETWRRIKTTHLNGQKWYLLQVRIKRKLKKFH